MSPFDSITMNRPLAERSPANEFTGLVPEMRLELVIWETKASGVELAGFCAVETALATSIHAAAAHKKAIISLIIKNPDERSKCSFGLAGD
ncbi:MAG: hypothetical protein DMF72_19310 [Acidobacteria bacterium]|nr:MAG: hypothetical protein DMF72_19310 [Acidobacteriota bacterium]